jgi:hypothetical protein
MKFPLFALFALLSTPAFASHVTAFRCDSVSATEGEGRSQMTFLIAASETTSNDKGILQISRRHFNVGGVSRDAINARFIGTDGVEIAGQLTSDSGAVALSKAGACETARDIGKVVLWLSANDASETK